MTRLPLAVVIEDDQELCRMYIDMLPLVGFGVIAFHRRPSAHAVMFANAPDIFLVDMMLNSETDGVEYARTLRGQGMTCPMVALSASNHQLEAARQTGLFAVCVPKPFDMWALAATMKKLLGIEDGEEKA